jgi:hypothetical protein
MKLNKSQANSRMSRNNDSIIGSSTHGHQPSSNSNKSIEPLANKVSPSLIEKFYSNFLNIPTINQKKKITPSQDYVSVNLKGAKSIQT